MIMRILGALSACLLLLCFGGCAGYRLGPASGLDAARKSIQVSAFSNHTPEPRLGDVVDAALRRMLQKDGTYRMANHGPADIVVTGTIIQYRRHELSFVPNDVLTVQDFRVTVKAQVVARETGSGKVVVDQPVEGFALVRVGSDLTSAERQAQPLLADDLARKVTTLLVDGNW